MKQPGCDRIEDEDAMIRRTIDHRTTCMPQIVNEGRVQDEVIVDKQDVVERIRLHQLSHLRRALAS